MSRHRSRHTEDAYAYFTSRAEAHGIRDLPLSFGAYEEEVGRRAAAEWERRMEEQMRNAGRAQRGTVEVITDPNDARGLDARPVGRA